MNAIPALVKPRFAADHDPLVALWLTRLCLGFKAAIDELNNSHYAEHYRKLIGITPREGGVAKSELRALLKVRLKELMALQAQAPTVLDKNVKHIARFLSLSALQCQILVFAAVSEQHRALSEFGDEFDIGTLDRLCELLAVALNASSTAIREALHHEGQLLSSGMLSIGADHGERRLLLVIPKTLRATLFRAAENLQTLVRSFLEPAPRASLKRASFAHLAEETELLQAYLTQASQQKISGVNVLIYGPPGTGKTEYVRWLVANIGKRLYQVRASDDQGNGISGLDRLAFFKLSQRFLQKTNDALIFFDEIEDVFPQSSAFEELLVRRPAVAGKLFINGLLEGNAVPAIWVANTVHQIDNAYLRRFDYSFEMGIPPLQARRRILADTLRGQRISQTTLDALAQEEHLSPAQVGKAVKVLKVSGLKSTLREATLQRVIDNSMVLLRQPRSEPFLDLTSCRYQLDYLNADCDLQQLLEQLKQAPQSVGALCFYGPPGTGKTALAHYLAKEIALPLKVQRASDIISPYVGETEQNIALMFKQAHQEGALLLLDEADSFLRERQSAKNSWEVTAVNEMLTQMERHEGLFVCSTNLMDRLDAASLRRFALKIKFDYLRPEQRWALFVAQAETLPPQQEASCRTQLNRLNQLTPGDFATVRRQAALLNIPLTADELLQRLTLECRAKTQGSSSPRQIGFVHV